MCIRDSLWGKKTPEERAKELSAYCNAHIKDTYELKDERYLCRIFYYDCPPISKNVYHPLTQKNVDFGKSETYSWTLSFFEELKQKRCV